MRLRSRVRLDILSGFLGSGKTTLLRRHLSAVRPATGIGVIINEFGATSVDHHLVRGSTDSPRVLAAGCACCTVAAELRSTLLDLLREDAEAGGTVLRRIVLETSGLADPAAILGTISNDPVLAEYVELGHCTVALDALDGTRCVERYPEARTQLAAADTIVLTKADLADSATVSGVRRSALTVNPLAEVRTAAAADFSAQRLFEGPTWRTAPPLASTQHANSVQSFVLSLPNDVDWAAFSVWLSALLHRHGERILRFKAIVPGGHIGGTLAVHGVRHLVYPPQHLLEVAPADRRSDLVFITDGLKKEVVDVSLNRFLDFAAGHRALLSDAELSGSRG